MTNRVAISTVLSWIPCEDYPHEKIRDLFSGRQEIGIPEAYDMGLPVNDFLWFAIHEPLMTRTQLKEFEIFALDRLPRGEMTDDTAEAASNAMEAAYGDVDDQILYRCSEYAQRWKLGASEPSRRAYLVAIWVAVALARASGQDDATRAKTWTAERKRQAEEIIAILGKG
jgi:hypothetical protein